MTTAPLYSRSANSKVSFMGTSRWLVGSSKINIFEGMSIMRTMASRAFSPPERLAIFTCMRSPRKRNFFMISCSSLSSIRISFASFTTCHPVFSKGRRSAWCCAKKPVISGSAGRTCPL
mmetsp:Transcript_20694/g.38849  ORF Transcript_20694/g.38849 Transcript_20694/m.38849 type:complete len:119 (-) Transcript_20694:20-376(-)